MSHWLTGRFSDPERTMDTICTVTSYLCGLAFVYLTVLLLVARSMFKQ